MSVTALCANTADPLFMWVTHNYVNRAENTAPAWGASIYLGEPLQPFSIRPSIDDFSMVALAGNCLGLTDYDCIARRGGVYDPGYSTTIHNSSDVEGWNGTIGSYDDTIFDYHNDVLTFGWNETKVYGWPFTTDDKDYWATRNWLGIGLNSSFLTAAVDAGAAPTHSWGMWTGSRSIKNPQDGLLILGGYDNARKGEEWTVFPGDEDCPTCIQISDIEWVTDTNATSLFNGSVEAIQVSLDPWYDNIRLPQGVWETFGSITKGEYDDDIGYFTWPAGTTPPGKLRVTLQGGYTSEIPAEEIFTMPRYYDSTGNYTISDNTTEYALVYNYTNTGTVSNAVGSWGLPFLTMNYLVLDVPKKEFWLTPAVRQDFGNEGGVFPRALCTGLAPPTSTPSSTPTTTHPGPTTTTSEAPASGGGTPVGPIVGGVVGGVGGIALIALLAFMLLRRRNRANKEAEIANSSAYPPAPPTQQIMQSPHQHHSYMGGPPPPGMYSPTHTGYPSSPFGNPAHNSMGYAGAPMGGFGAPQSDYSNDMQQHTGPQFYSPSPSVKPEHASMVYSDTATAVPELASPGQPNTEWRGDGAKDMSATVSRPFDGTWSDGPHQR